jgi:hypothetical protein
MKRSSWARASVLLDDPVADVGPVEAGDEHPRVAAARSRSIDLGAGVRVGGGRQRDARHLGKALVQDRQLQVLGPEVVAPLRYAVGLIDREAARSARAQAGPGSASVTRRSGAT